MLTLGIDPGTDGGAALFENLKLIRVISFKYDKDWENSLAALVWVNQPDRIICERVHAWKGNGAKAMFTFGTVNKGAIEAVKRHAKTPIEFVEPTAWMLWLRLPQFKQIGDRHKRRKLRRAEQEKRALMTYLDELEGVQGDVYGAVLIAEAGATGLRGKER